MWRTLQRFYGILSQLDRNTGITVIRNAVVTKCLAIAEKAGVVRASVTFSEIIVQNFCPLLVELGGYFLVLSLR